MFRCIELDHATVEEMVEVLAPTLAYGEDEFGGRPSLMRLCGFAAEDPTGDQLAAELGLTAERVQSPLGLPTEFNAGLHGLLASSEVH